MFTVFTANKLMSSNPDRISNGIFLVLLLNVNLAITIKNCNKTLVAVSCHLYNPADHVWFPKDFFFGYGSFP